MENGNNYTIYGHFMPHPLWENMSTHKKTINKERRKTKGQIWKRRGRTKDGNWVI